MRELERDRAFFSARFCEPAFPVPDDEQNDPADGQATSWLAT
jgi:hypothetical protein